MSSAILLAVHGSPPQDFPRAELVEFMRLHSAHGHDDHRSGQGGHERYHELHKRMRDWPRTHENDPFWAGSMDLARRLEAMTGVHVYVGFNEFCGPDIEEALESAVDQGARRVVVLTPMLTRGGEHAEHDIPSALEKARIRHPGVEVVYGWPFDPDKVVGLLAAQAARWL